jgi:hypothetical protein
MSSGSTAATSSGASPAGQSSSASGGPPAQVVDVVASSAADEPATSHGANWAIQEKVPADVPIRRTIHVVVRSDRVAILPEPVASARAASGGKEVMLDDTTSANFDPLVSALREHIREWGTAGQGLYWRPVILLTVGPDGNRRADDLARLLKTSGFELRIASAAQQSATTPIQR